MYSHILVALDGSEASDCAGQAALAIAAATGARLTVCHVYGVGIHRQRFGAMEPGLPSKYQQTETLDDLREAHDRLMDEGFRALSTGYVEDLVNLAKGKGVTAKAVTMEGRNYVGILRLAETLRADLIAVGADGLGAVGDGMLGGTTARVLQAAPCDVFVARRVPDGGPIIAGVDGSHQALEAVSKATKLGKAMGKAVQAVAVYDPDFHTRVFGVMAHSLSPECQEEVGLANQEQLHDDIINDGLGKLYTDFLSVAKQRYGDKGMALETILLTGKAYCALNQQAIESHADLIVVGRYGHHIEPGSILGSNADGVLRRSSTNVLLVGRVATDGKPPVMAGMAKEILGQSENVDAGDSVVWDEQARARLQRVPSFARSMARKAVENAVRKEGKHTVSAEDFNQVAAQFGMGPGKSDA